jgi:diguanylate cyclase
VGEDEEYKVKYWKSKHRDALREMDTQEAAWKTLEQILRRLVTRLCTAAMGSDPRLDAELNRVSTANRRTAAAPELELLYESLAKAIAELPDSPRNIVSVTATRPPMGSSASSVAATLPAVHAAPARHAEPHPVDVAPPHRERWDATIAAVGSLLTRLSPPDAPNALAQALLAELQQIESDNALARVIERAADLVRERSDRLTRERLEAGALLTQVTKRLDDVAAFIASGSGERRATIDDADTLNQHVLDEVRELSDEAQRATDLAPLRAQIAVRMDSISTQVQQFRAREESRFLEHSARTENLSRQVAELTRQTRALEADLDKERQRARIDALTGVANRASFDERLAEEITRFQRAGTPVAVLYWDIDHFKAINDSFGHSAGDRVLREVARCFAGRLRGSDFVARTGGEEFVTLLIGTPTSGAMKVADDLRQAVSALRMHFRGTPVPVTVSCGVTELRAGDTAEAVLDRADSALYKAKDHGRNACIAA